jgi:MFS family permease
MTPLRRWLNVVLAALLMVATLPGRTSGLGLITEPLLRDLQLDRLTYAQVNLWATLLGALVCLPLGWLLDRCGVRWTSTALVALLGAVVWQLSRQPAVGAGSLTVFFLLILLTRAFGQSALSVASITAIGKSSRSGVAMGVYSVLLTLCFIGAFWVVGEVVRHDGWRPAWQGVALGLAIVAPIVALLLREPPRAGEPADPSAHSADAASGHTLWQAIRTSAFWIFAAGISLFSLALSGLALFNEAVLAERGFDQKTYVQFMIVSIGTGLLGQLTCGILIGRSFMPRLLGLALMLYAAGLAALPLLRTPAQLWIFAALFGIAGGMITVVFFAIWGEVFGRAQLGRIQGAAQTLTVFASALGPLLFAACHAQFQSYAPVLVTLAALAFVLGAVAWKVKLPRPAGAASIES